MMRVLFVLLFLPTALFAQKGDNRETPSSKGANSVVDVTHFGVRAINPLTTPYAIGLTADCVSGKVSVHISSAWNGVNGDGVVLYGCGPAHSMTIPPPPTITPSIASAPTGTGYMVPGPAGSTHYCYQITARDALGGQTAASSQVCTTTGSGSLGSQSVSIRGSFRVLSTTTVTTSTDHGLPVGCTSGSCPKVFIKGTSNDAQFGGWFVLDSVPDTTHFTYTSGLDTRGYPAAQATSVNGIAYYWNGNHLVLPAPGKGVWEYAIYGRKSGHLSLLATSMPAISVLSGDSTYMVWDDFGSPMMDGVSVPAFVSTKSPIVASNDNLVTKIVSGAGTTTLTLATAPSNTISRATIRFDNAPNIAAAFSAANASDNGGGEVYFPAPVTQPGVLLAYGTNSFLALRGAVSQAGALYLGDTLEFSGSWYGNLTLNGSQSVCPQFCIEGHIPIYTYTANPGMWLASGNLKGVAFVPTGNAYNALFITGGIPTATITDSTFGNGGHPGDYMGVPVIQFAQVSPGGAAGIVYRQVMITTGPSQVDGSTSTPSFVSKNYGEVSIDGIMLNRRGLFFKPNQSGLGLDFNMRYEIQGGITPLISTYFSGGSVAGAFKLSNTTLDTMSHPLIANFGATGGAINMALSIDNAGPPSAGMPLISGRAFPAVFITNSLSIPLSQIGQNKNIVVPVSTGCAIDGVFNSIGNCATYTKSVLPGVGVGPSSSVWIENAAPPAPKCTTSSGGSVPTGTDTYTYVPVFPNGAEGTPSSPCTSMVTSGNQTVTVSWNAMPVAIGYDVYRNHQLVSSSGCTPPQTRDTSFVDTSGWTCGPGQPNVSAGGPSGLSQGDVWGPTIKLGVITTPPKPFNGTNMFCLASDNCWPAFNTNGLASKNLFVGSVYYTQSVASSTNLSPIPMVARTSAIHSYLFSWTVSLTAPGLGCVGSTTVTLNEIHTDPNATSPVIVPLRTMTLASSGNGTPGFVASGTDSILSKSGTSVQYSTSSYSPGSGCSTNPTYQVSPTLVQLW
jgi:hypothetical protein